MNVSSYVQIGDESIEGKNAVDFYFKLSILVMNECRRELNLSTNIYIAFSSLVDYSVGITGLHSI